MDGSGERLWVADRLVPAEAWGLVVQLPADLLGRDLEHHGFAHRRHRGRGRARVQKRHLAQHITGAHDRDTFSTEALQRNREATLKDDEERLALDPLLNDDLAIRHTPALTGLDQPLDVVVVQDTK